LLRTFDWGCSSMPQGPSPVHHCVRQLGRLREADGGIVSERNCDNAPAVNPTAACAAQWRLCAHKTPTTFFGGFVQFNR
jgi:hypothetical protein